MPNELIICSCGCGREFKPLLRNGIIQSKLHPNCRLKKELNKAKSRQAKSGDKNQTHGSKTKRKKNPIDKKLDIAWSKLIKLRANGKCEVCGKEKPLNSHHLFSRAKRSVRWSPLNGICLCVGHHIGNTFSAHKTPLEFNEWLIENKGREFIDNLRLIANSTSNYSDFEKEMILKELQSEINKYK